MGRMIRKWEWIWEEGAINIGFQARLPVSNYANLRKTIIQELISVYTA